MANTPTSQHALKDFSVHLGMIGSLAFAVFVLIFREDWTDRYRSLSYLLPLPAIGLLIARWQPLPGGLLLLASGIGAAVIDFYATPGHPGRITGLGLGYTLVFVSLPLALSGVFTLARGWKRPENGRAPGAQPK